MAHKRVMNPTLTRHKPFNSLAELTRIPESKKPANKLAGFSKYD